jgi:integrase
MSVSKRGNSWQAYINIEGERLRKSFSTKVDATAWEALARQAIRNGKPVPNMGSSETSVTFSKAADAAYRMFWRGGKSDEKMVQYIRLLERQFGTRYPVANFTTQVIDNYINELKDAGNSNATINRKLAALSKILRHQHDLGTITSIPKIHRQKEGKNRIRWLTKEEENAILETLRDWGKFDIADAAVVAVDTGLRHSELIGLTFRDITKDGVYLHDTKNGEPRLVPLTSRARQVLESRVLQQKASGSNSQRIFPKGSRDWLRSTWDRLRNQLELDDVVWHTFRHTTCSRLVQGGVPLLHVKEWMGHSSIQTTMRYAHLAPKHLQEVVNVLE